HIPRPLNAYIIFRLEYVTIHKNFLSKTQQTASVKAGAAWHELPKESQDYYRELAKQRKEEHERTYPGYKYQPRRSKCG
ncbi:high mobility group box domain-containing protein, partial [Armillaria luteobubalina]